MRINLFIHKVLFVFVYMYMYYTNIFIMRFIKLDLKINKSISC